jgi:four helix bundle protein
MKETFTHENLDVYCCSVEFLVVADEVAGSLQRGRGYLSDQLRRAATSITLNIAEGAGEFARTEKARFYRIAKRSTTECAAILDVCRQLGLSDSEQLLQGRALLLRIVAMLTRLVQSGADSDADSDAGNRDTS